MLLGLSFYYTVIGAIAEELHLGGWPGCILVDGQDAFRWMARMHLGGWPGCILVDGQDGQDASWWMARMHLGGRPLSTYK